MGWKIINVVKMPVQLNLIYRVNTLNNKILVAFLTEIENTFLKYIWNYREPESLEQKQNIGRHYNFWFQNILQSYSHQSSMMREQNQNTTENPEKNPCNYGLLIFDTGEKTSSLINDFGKSISPYAEEKKLGLCLSICKKSAHSESKIYI